VRRPGDGAAGAAMTVWLWVGLVLALLIFAYVGYALLKAEDFA
jgi:hypothetical protein